MIPVQHYDLFNCRLTMVELFVYGTLLHPEVLKWVIDNDGSHLHICPALLTEFTRHQVKDADYPAILPYWRSRSMFDHDPKPDHDLKLDHDFKSDHDLELDHDPKPDHNLKVDHDLKPDQRSVRGSLVSGLTDQDIEQLDIFEGDEYKRERARVHPLGPYVDMDDMPKFDLVSFVTSMPPPVLEPVEVDAYVWCAPITDLNPNPWEFDEAVCLKWLRS